MCGILKALERNGWADVRVVGAEPEGAPKLTESLRAGHVITLPSVDTIITSLAGRTVAQGLFDEMKKHDAHIELVSDKEAVQATKNFLDFHRVLVEPSCGACLSLLYNKHELLKDAKTVLAIICGGTAINYKILTDYMHKFDISAE